MANANVDTDAMYIIGCFLPARLVSTAFLLPRLGSPSRLRLQ